MPENTLRRFLSSDQRCEPAFAQLLLPTKILLTISCAPTLLFAITGAIELGSIGLRMSSSLKKRRCETQFPAVRAVMAVAPGFAEIGERPRRRNERRAIGACPGQRVEWQSAGWLGRRQFAVAAPVRERGGKD